VNTTITQHKDAQNYFVINIDLYSVCMVFALIFWSFCIHRLGENFMITKRLHLLIDRRMWEERRNDTFW